MLCARCQDLFEGHLSQDKTRASRQNHDSWTLERISNHGGCVICHKSWQTFVKDHGLPPSDDTKFSVARSIKWIDRSSARRDPKVVALYDPEIRVTYSTISAAGQELISFVSCSPSSADDHPDLESSMLELEAGDSTASDYTMQVALNWIHNCITNHDSCRVKSVPSTSPTRLLELFQPIYLHVRLIETATLKSMPTYMTLSHCWGSAEFFKLTADTSSELADGISLDLLPKTFQDAISIAWRLGVKYLWIDSLCIFQDSISDWEREATTMSVVYAGSFCNIVASASSSSHEGCFRGRDPRVVKPSVIDVRYTERLVSMVYIRSDHIFAGSDRGNGGWFRSSDVNFPLFKRGWTVQERVLSPRNLHFGDEHTLWECEESCASEIYPMGNFKFGVPLKMISTFKLKADDHWRNIVQVYSKCLLTEERDKLIAIGGIAKHFSQCWDWGNYVAGLWSKYIINQMLWETVNPSKSVRPQRYRAPSWSWASIDGEVCILYRVQFDSTEETIVEVKEVQIEYATDTPYGGVLSAKLYISGHLSACTIDFGTFAADPFGGWDQRISLEVSRGEIGFSARVVLDVESVDFKLQTSLVFLPMICLCTKVGGGSWCEGLLLQATELAALQFKRCGVLKIADYEPRFFDISGKGAGITEPPSTAESFNGSLRTICII